MQFTFYKLKPLCSDMRRNNISIEQFYITYAGTKFDIVIDIDSQPFQMMIGVVDKNFAFVLDIHIGFKTEIPNDIYFELCRILSLNYKEDHFSSLAFLSFVDKHIPPKSKKTIVNPDHLLPFRKYECSDKDERRKTRFKGWNDHTKDKKQAHDFDKTELYLGKTVADYCRAHNVSSLWTYPDDDSIRDISFPPGMNH